ncbi:hypothetical protein QDW23_gp41 [Microbacterium phage Stromboli]|uniref:hypothetical protein n=1 Tax=Microbacterium Phage DirtyBubble TaxID=2590932 RepID=UPI001189191B|nr:hypothetical protein QDW22_gp40 [Microbacterium Phage DirtyBubble]YP_010752705.1 hypothetical protein QDW23_gp41 [Microbacterium phage Stromboli]QDP45058.1 hypothetical protein DIRTYBUBBLE_40 [Microbacterium Phage DirtyBubble]QIN93700.1 hypothetical protein SEA_STROMBOLI_41 [Microbacterium phage Stromboli]QTF81975.1 hypothetical protein SEA_BABYYODA_41 [Microbacterium phage BabyYoda]
MVARLGGPQQPEPQKPELPNPLDIIEAANNFADLAATFRDALLDKGFASAPSEMTALQVAAGIFSQGGR